MTRSRGTSLLRLAGAIASVVVAAGILSAAGVSVSAKPFTASMLSAADSTATFIPGSPGTWYYTITDADHNGVPSSQVLGSAHITIPSPGWNVTSVSIHSAPTSWTADVNASTGQVEVQASTQSDRLAGGQSVVVAIQATPSCGAASPSAWPIVVKQSNQFLGSGNDFFLDGPAPSLTASAVGAGPLASFQVTTSPSPATAGQGFTVTATALDTCGRTVTSYSPVGLAPSGNLSTSATAPPGDTTSPSYATFSWAMGVGTATVVPKKAEGNRTVTVTDPGTAATGTSAPFIVQPNPNLFPAFANQPSDAQASTTIFSNVVTQTPVTVSVADAWGNAAPDGTNVSMTGPAGLKGTTSQGTSSGTATFGNLSLAVIGTYNLTAQVGSNQATSAPFQIVTALKVCDNLNKCTAPASSPNGNQSADTTITAAPNTTFQGGVVLESTFGSDFMGCAGFAPIPGTLGSDVQVHTSTNFGATQPTFTITYTIPKATLKAAGLANLGASQFQVCLGAKRLDGNTGGWTDISGFPIPNIGAGGFYWGIVPPASSSLPANNPFISSQHKNGAGDLIIVLVKPYPWDGWGYV